MLSLKNVLFDSLYCPSMPYLRETKRMLKFGLADVRNKTLENAHMNTSAFQVTVCRNTCHWTKQKNNILYIKEGEKYNINCFNTFYKSLNKKKKYWGGFASYYVHNCTLYKKSLPKTKKKAIWIYYLFTEKLDFTSFLIYYLTITINFTSILYYNQDPK